ncbi:ParA family protein [Bacillus thuringiensis]|uniref:Sporulation initiation inhibitor protein Soj n=1 Tax=Bacillus thuringiensis TaxID=1428 RepID=A0A9W3VH15_BACTU|nr:ParA family protein [Bacillus thuringiensis]AMR06478.1 chromosome partitioning protein ParA [Bacillus thuringiensis]AYF85209.1 ParA family protein [Bacillus thuringiensis]PNK35027.1 chromosome partitioning protein ParA [Bacillus thuringiensis]
MTEIIAVSTNKGGVLKTTSVTNLAGVYAREGKKVLIIDTDNQGNAIMSFGKNPRKCKVTIYDILIHGDMAEKGIINVHKNIDMIPANHDMSKFDFKILPNLNMYPNMFGLLAVAMRDIVDLYDVILIDTPPTLGLVQGNVLAFANKVLIPFQPEAYSVESLQNILEMIKEFKEKKNPNLEIAGVFATLVDGRTNIHKAFIDKAKKYCKKNKIIFLETVIPQSVRFANAVAYEGKPAVIHEPYHEVSRSYFKLVKEMA